MLRLALAPRSPARLRPGALLRLASQPLGTAAVPAPNPQPEIAYNKVRGRRGARGPREGASMCRRPRSPAPPTDSPLPTPPWPSGAGVGAAAREGARPGARSGKWAGGGSEGQPASPPPRKGAPGPPGPGAASSRGSRPAEAAPAGDSCGDAAKHPRAPRPSRASRTDADVTRRLLTSAALACCKTRAPQARSRCGKGHNSVSGLCNDLCGYCEILTNWL